MDEQISYNIWNILQISILRFRFFFGAIGIPQSSKNNTPGLIKAMFFFRFTHWNGAKLGRFCSHPVFHPSHPPGPSGWPEVFFPSSKPPNFVVSPWAHLWLWESGILVTGPEMGGSREVSTRETLGSRIHEKDFISLEPAKKKTQQLRLKRFQRWQCFASACFWMFQGSSGCFTGWWCWEMATASQVKVERFHKLFLWNSLSAVISWKFLATVTCLCA